MKIIDLQGIGAAYAARLTTAGIRTVETLLKKGSSPKGRKEIAEKTGIGHELILDWVNHADLCRIKGVGPQYAELLEKSGVDSVVELSKRVSENLHNKMIEVNQTHEVVRALPGLKQVESWIVTAKRLPRAVS
jgi:predicted flap endonuclease-1-like 5' DNA nuclease